MSRKTTARRPAKRPKPRQARQKKAWNLRLYIAGATPRATSALENLKAICEQHLAGQYRIEVIDLLKHPQLAKGDQIVAVPTLVKKLPAPLRRLIGNLAARERVLLGLDLRHLASGSAS